ncbi:MAG: thiamine biosynthesis protein ThiS [Firmicutes bacterium]|nr:thiamine biosynthesis protein ThiS [Bacillota bacterium]
MIKVNQKDYPWTEGLTLQQLLDKLNFTFPLMIVTINSKTVYRDKYACTQIEDGDDIQAIHLICGG